MIYILGGKGFVGSAFVRLFEKENKPYKIITRDNYDELIGSSCDVFINANGNSKKFLADKDPKEEFDSTIKPVCYSLHDFSYKKYVLCSTCDVYNDFENPEFNKEDSFIDINKQSRYGFHKYMAENFVKYEANDYIIIRFGGFVGSDLKKNPIFDIINGGPLWLNPNSKLQYLHVDEAATIVWKLISGNIKNEIFNVCGNGLVKLKDVMELVRESIEVKENTPTVVYNINTEKINKIYKISSSKEIVFKFVEQQK